jgi:hypothetical protein
MIAGRVVVQLEEVTNSCFVVMPFHPLFDAEYERVIKPAVEEAGLMCVRGDEIYTRQSIVQDIWHSVRKARLVVAELSGRNPNVMYEIGLAHAIGKPIVLLTRNEDDVPFDLRALRYVYYDPNNPFWGENLRTELTRLIKMILANPSLAAHLGGVEVETTLPAAPTQPILSETTLLGLADFSGVWYATWLSIKREREHQATLVIPAAHGTSFTASMTVTYERESQQTIVQETLTGNYRDGTLFLTGVNYTYVEQGSSSFYSLDSFELQPEKDGKALAGKAVLRHGVRDVSFTRIQGSTS